LGNTEQNDYLINALKSFKNLLNTEYMYVINTCGHDKKESALRLKFQKENFFHLTGCQYLKDVRKIQKYIKSDPKTGKTVPKAKFFDEVESQAITIDTLKSSVFYSDIEERLKNLEKFENILDKSLSIFEWDGFIRNYDKGTYEVTRKKSEIIADYIIRAPLEKDVQNKLYAFIIADRGSKEFFRPVSFISEEKTDYCLNQKYVTLLVKKKRINTQDSETLYILPSYLKHHPEIIPEESIYIASHPECSVVVKQISNPI